MPKKHRARVLLRHVLFLHFLVFFACRFSGTGGGSQRVCHRKKIRRQSHRCEVRVNRNISSHYYISIAVEKCRL